MRLITTEQISKYHPDKYADQISDAILDACLEQDKRSRVACEVMVKDTTVVLGGEITTAAVFNYDEVVYRVANKLGYRVNKIINLIGRQSQEINLAVDQEATTGAEDQGIMFGYASQETPELLPYGLYLANKIIKLIEEDVEKNPNTILFGDAKCQVTVDQDMLTHTSTTPKGWAVKKILISACHSSYASLDDLKDHIKNLINRNLYELAEVDIIINPAGTWTIGGPIADCGLTGRKIVCDQYGPYSPVGGGAFSGKDPTKVDRSAAYMARYLAKYVVNTYHVHECTVQLSYAIGKAEPFSVNVTIPGIYARTTVETIAHDLRDRFDLTPSGIIQFLGLLNRKYEKMAEGYHLAWV